MTSAKREQRESHIRSIMPCYAAENQIDRQQPTGIRSRPVCGLSARRPRLYCARRDPRRDGRVAEGARLESVYTGNRIVGSNPTPSATDPSRPRSPLPASPPVSACPAGISAGTSGPRRWQTTAFGSPTGPFSPELCTFPIWYRASKVPIARHLRKVEFEIALALRPQCAQLRQASDGCHISV
jgi:hypothetical protein